MQAGTCKLPCVNSDVVVMWCIPPPYSSPSFEVPAIFLERENWGHFPIGNSQAVFSLEILIFYCLWAWSWHWFRQVTAPCNVACASGIVTVNSPSGSTLQCGTWLYADIPLHSPKRLPYWNSTSGFDFDHITAVDMSCCTSLQNFIQIGPPSAEKITSCRF